ncbi:MAG: YdcF family protein [Actinomycetota bacterium]
MFVLGKVVGWLADPANLFYVAAALAWLLLPRAGGRRLLGATLAMVAALGVVPLDRWGIAWLEDRFPPPAAMPARVDGIIVLGGAIDPAVSAARGQVALGGAAERLTEMVALARSHPEAKLVFSGGSGRVLDQTNREADWARRFFLDIGFDDSRVIYERDSRTTRENAVLSKDLAKPAEGETWLLVTSAMHMPRSVGCFRAAGWPVVPYPVDYQTAGPGAGLRLSFNLGGYGALAHEFIGLASYRLSGWTDALLPAPADKH